MHSAGAEFGLDTHETNPVLLRKMQRWKKEKHRQRIAQARRAGKKTSREGVPFGRTARLPPVARAARSESDEPDAEPDADPRREPARRDRERERERADGQRGERGNEGFSQLLEQSLQDLEPLLAGRTTPERALDDYTNRGVAHDPVPSGATRERPPPPRKKQARRRGRRPAQPEPLSSRAAFDCTPAASTEACTTRGGLKVRREPATREPPRRLAVPQRAHGASPGSRSGSRSRSRSRSRSPGRSETPSSESQPSPLVDRSALAAAQRTIAELRQQLHIQRENGAQKVEEATKAVRDAAQRTEAELAQAKTQLRLLQKQLVKARKEDTANSQQRAVSVQSTQTSTSAGTCVERMRIRVRPRSESSKHRRGSPVTPPSTRIPGPRGTAPGTFHQTAPELTQFEAVLAADDVQLAPAPARPSALEGIEPAALSCASTPTPTPTPDPVDEDIVQLTRLDSSCSFCVTGSPPQGGEESDEQEDDAGTEPAAVEQDTMS